VRLVPAGLRYLLSGARSSRRDYARTVAIRATRAYHRDRWRYSLRRFGAYVDDIPIDRPIFVLGVQGGGTTLVARSLLRHPEVVSMGGNSSFWVATDEMGFVRNRMMRLPRTLWSSSHRDDLDHPLFGASHDSMYASGPLYDAYRNVGADANERDAAAFRRVIREHIAVYAHDHRHARFLDKTHTLTLKIPYVEELLRGTSPHYLLIARDPYSTCYRAVRRKPPAWTEAPPYEEQLRLAAEHWANSLRTALEDGPRTGRFSVVRFEDFVRDPEATVRGMCEFTGLPFDPELVPREGQSRPFGMLPTDTKWYPLFEDPWRNRVPPEDIAIVDAVVGDVARELGYAPESG
jgi:Sulfotransferase family